MVKGRRRNQRGQSIVEYLVVVAAIIAAIIGIGAAVGDRTTALSNSATGRIDAAATTVETNVAAARQ